MMSRIRRFPGHNDSYLRTAKPGDVGPVLNYTLRPQCFLAFVRSFINRTKLLLQVHTILLMVSFV